jgi:23S rRNA pseudouridine1911/1915/1917 synthase
MTEPRTFIIAPGHAGMRLDRWLAEALELPRSYVHRLIELGKITQPHPAAPGQRLAAGECVSVAPFRHPREGPLASPDMPLPILATQGAWVAVDKPAGTPAHPLHYEERYTIVNAFLARYPDAVRVGDGGLYAGLVHRLDPGTSGVLLFAAEHSAWEHARAEFSGRRAEKHYVARVHGGLPLAQPRTVTLRLAARGARMRVVESGGREAVTRLLRSTPAGGDTSRVEIDLVSGVRHQIRATLAALGHPVVGDTLYGAPPAARIALHAAALRVGDFAIRSPVPAGF